MDTHTLSPPYIKLGKKPFESRFFWLPSKPLDKFISHILRGAHNILLSIDDFDILIDSPVIFSELVSAVLQLLLFQLVTEILEKKNCSQNILDHIILTINYI